MKTVIFKTNLSNGCGNIYSFFIRLSNGLTLMSDVSEKSRERCEEIAKAALRELTQNNTSSQS